MTITRQRVVRQQGLRALWQENNGHFPVKPLYFLHFAERIHKPSATPTGSHGRWQWSQGAETPHFSRTTAVSPSEPRRKADSLSRCSAILPAAGMEERWSCWFQWTGWENTTEKQIFFSVFCFLLGKQYSGLALVSAWRKRGAASWPPAVLGVYRYFRGILVWRGAGNKTDK